MVLRARWEVVCLGDWRWGLGAMGRMVVALSDYWVLDCGCGDGVR